MNYFRYIMAAVLAMLIASLSSAQVRRKTTTTARKSSPSTRVKKTVTKKDVVKTIACYETKAKSIAMGNKYIYYLEPGENNAVIGINRETGEKETIIPGIAGIYEGARPRIYKVFASGNRLFFYIYTKDDFDKVYLYDGKSVETSSRLDSWGKIVETTDKRAVIVSTEYQYELWDTENMRRIANYGGKKWEKAKHMPEWYDNPYFIIAPDDAIWRDGSDMYGYGLFRFDKDGKYRAFGLSKEEYVVKNNLNSSLGHMKASGDFLYICKNRRVYRMNMVTQSPWEEYAKIPVNENKTFHRIYPDSKGNFMTRGESSASYNIEYYKANALDAPIALGESNFKSGLDVWDRTAIWWSLCPQIMVDSYDNFLFFNDEGVLYVYNPNGVVGYTKAIGQVIK